MQVSFWNFSKKSNSTARPGGAGVTFEVVLKNPTSIMAPVLEMKASPLVNRQPPNPAIYNMCYIPAFGRYYTIQNWTANGSLWTAQLTVDVLRTYRDRIGASSQYIVRSSRQSDGRVVDNYYPVVGDSHSSRTSVEIPWVTNAGYFVVGIIGGNTGSAAGAISYFAMTTSEFNRFGAELFNPENYKIADTSYLTAKTTGDTPSTTEYTLSDDLWLSYFNPVQYIRSCRYFPCGITEGAGRTASPYIAGHKMNVTAIRVTGSTQWNYTFTVGLPKHPQAARRGEYLNYAPFTRYLIDIPPFGSFPLDASIYGHYRSVAGEIKVDFMSGIGYLRAGGYDNTKTFTIATSSQIAIPVTVSQSSFDYGAMVSGFTARAGNALTGNFGAAFGNLIGSIEAGSVPQLGTVGGSGSTGAYTMPVRLTREFSTVAEEDNRRNGRPLMQERVISSIPGFIICKNAAVDTGGTASENAEVVAQMNGGFYYE